MPPPRIAVAAGPEGTEEAWRSRHLAEELRLPLVTQPARDGPALILACRGHGLELRYAQDPPGQGLCVSFAGLDLRPGSRSLSRRQPLARAIGLASTVADATAGLGQDAMLLAALGCSVTAIERSPIIAALLRDGLERAARRPQLAAFVRRIRLITCEARTILPLLQPPPEVVYIDPMFPPKRKRSALAPKAIRLVREVVGEDADAPELLDAARSCATSRVVVKRPPWAAPLRPDSAASHGGKLARYDVYRPLRADRVD